MGKTIAELNELSGADFLRECWHDAADHVIDAIRAEAPFDGTYDEFLSACTCCGGNWGGMLLTGIDAVWPRVYKAIPEDMGVFAWPCLCEVLKMLGVNANA